MLLAIIAGLLGGWTTNICVSLYLHRTLAHASVRLHPIVSHPMRFWIWLTTGMVAREWVAVHRKHHAFSDKPGDPHSPVVYGLWAILLKGVWFYRRESMNAATLQAYGTGCPDDWIERHLYTRFSNYGILLWLPVCMAGFGPLAGAVCWLAQVTWTPIWAAGVINGIGHALGYRNFTVNNLATNIVPIGVWIGGEELHNNHHRFPRSAKFAYRWWEFDFIWCLVRGLMALRLATGIYVHNRRYQVAKAEAWIGKMESRFARWSAVVQQLQSDNRIDWENRRQIIRERLAQWTAVMEKRYAHLHQELRPYCQERFDTLLAQLQGLYPQPALSPS